MHAADGTPPLPTFVIVGAMKAGTTALARYLGAHPDVFMAPEKEAHFFDRHFDEGIDAYRQQFAEWRGERAIGEATPGYMMWPVVVERLATVLPDARLLVMLRDPVERAYSHYWQNRERGVESRSFADAVRTEPARLAEARDSAYLLRGHYEAQLARLAAHFPREAILVQLFDDLAADPVGVYRAACTHVGVDADIVPAVVGRPVNPYATFRSPWLRRLVRHRRGPAARVIARLNVRRRAAYPPMDPAVRAELLEQFREPNLALERWLDRDLSAWQH